MSDNSMSEPIIRNGEVKLLTNPNKVRTEEVKPCQKVFGGLINVTISEAEFAIPSNPIGSGLTTLFSGSVVNQSSSPVSFKVYGQFFQSGYANVTLTASTELLLNDIPLSKLTQAENLTVTGVIYLVSNQNDMEPSILSGQLNPKMEMRIV